MKGQAILKGSQEDLSFLDKTSNLTKQERIGAWFERIVIWVVIAITMFPVVAVVSASLADCLLYTSPSPRDPNTSRMPSSA